MKKFIAILCMAVLFSSTVEARPHGRSHHHNFGGPIYHYTSHHHHHGSDIAAGLAIGLIGGSILNYAINPPQRKTVTTTYSSANYAPIVVSSPVITTQAISEPTVITNSQPCYTTTNLVTGQNITQCSSIITSSPVITQVVTGY